MAARWKPTFVVPVLLLCLLLPHAVACGRGADQGDLHIRRAQ